MTEISGGGVKNLALSPCEKRTRKCHGNVDWRSQIFGVKILWATQTGSALCVAWTDHLISSKGTWRYILLASRYSALWSGVTECHSRAAMKEMLCTALLTRFQSHHCVPPPTEVILKLHAAYRGTNKSHLWYRLHVKLGNIKLQFVDTANGRSCVIHKWLISY